MNNVYKITLNANNASPVITTLVFKQGDKGQKLAFTVEELDRTGATSAIIAFSRSNGTSVEAPLTAVDGGYEYIIQGNEFAVPGRVVADLKFYQGDTGRVSTTSFVFGVYDDTLDGLGGGAGGYSDVLEQLRDEGEAAKQSFIAATAEAMIYAQRAEDAAERAMQGTPEGYAAVVAQVEANAGAIELDEQDMLDLKMLGYTIPHEMPVKNYVDSNGVFYQRVERVDLGTLTFSVSSDPNNLYYISFPSMKTADNNGQHFSQKYHYYGYISSADNLPLENFTARNGRLYIKSANIPTGYLYYELATEKTMPIDGNEKAAVTETNIQELKILGWTTPKECPVQNEINGNVFTQKVGRVDLGTLSWDANNGVFSVYGIVTKIPNMKTYSNTVLAKCYSNGYSVDTYQNVFSHSKDKSIAIGSGAIIVYDSSCTTVAQIKNTLQGKYFYYELATPLTYSIADDGIEFDNAGAHNCRYRGKFLGNVATAAQYAAIANNSFRDLYPGDYWEINGRKIRVGACNYYLNCGDTNLTIPHLLLVFDDCLYNAQMNESNTTAGGYANSKMRTDNLAQAEAIVEAAFPGHVLTHRIYVTNAVTNGRPSKGAWVDSKVDLMNEQMVFGGAIFSPTSDGTNVPVNFRVEKSQLPLFALEPGRICNRNTWWLRDVINAADFAGVSAYSVAEYTGASYSRGVRPAFCIY